MNSTGKYKTVLCKHFGQNGTCSYGDKCQFAHGFQELKNSGDISSITNDNSSMNKNKTKAAPNPSNFKIVKCKNWETSGNCKYGSVCTFAHGDTELRTKSENTQQINENAVMMDTGFMPNSMNPYLMNDPNMLYQMMMQQQMMGMGNMNMYPGGGDMSKNMNYMDMNNMGMGYNNMGMPNSNPNLNNSGMPEGVNLNDNNNMFFGGGMGYGGDMNNMNPNNMNPNNMNPNNMNPNNMNPNNMNPGNMSDNNSNSNMYMGGKQ